MIVESFSFLYEKFKILSLENYPRAAFQLSFLTCQVVVCAEEQKMLNCLFVKTACAVRRFGFSDFIKKSVFWKKGYNFIFRFYQSLPIVILEK